MYTSPLDATFKQPERSSAALLRRGIITILSDSGYMPIRPNHVFPTDYSAYAGYRFPPEIIMLAVRWYLRYGLSYRDVEELLAERGIEVDHVTIYRWVQRFTPSLIDAARPCHHIVGNRWFVDETYVKVSGTWRYVYRAVDQHGLAACSRHRRIRLPSTQPASSPNILQDSVARSR